MNFNHKYAVISEIPPNDSNFLKDDDEREAHICTSE
jgi:hypothetical protein